jgi:Outer membrane efflux protein
VSYARSQDRDVQLQLAANDSKRAADLASVRYKNGATSLLDLLDAQRVQLQAEDAYAESHSNTALDAVLLYKSLAGGWPQHLAASTTGGTPWGAPPGNMARGDAKTQTWKDQSVDFRHRSDAWAWVSPMAPP